MPKYQYYLTEKTTVFKEIEAEDLDQANELIEEFMYSDEMDWGSGDMEVSAGYIGRADDVQVSS